MNNRKFTPDKFTPDKDHIKVLSQMFLYSNVFYQDIIYSNGMYYGITHGAMMKPEGNIVQLGFGLEVPGIPFLQK